MEELKLLYAGGNQKVLGSVAEMVGRPNEVRLNMPFNKGQDLSAWQAAFLMMRHRDLPLGFLEDAIEQELPVVQVVRSPHEISLMLGSHVTAGNAHNIVRGVNSYLADNSSFLTLRDVMVRRPLFWQSVAQQYERAKEVAREGNGIDTVAMAEDLAEQWGLNVLQATVHASEDYTPRGFNYDPQSGLMIDVCARIKYFYNSEKPMCFLLDDFPFYMLDRIEVLDGDEELQARLDGYYVKGLNGSVLRLEREGYEIVNVGMQDGTRRDVAYNTENDWVIDLTEGVTVFNMNDAPVEYVDI
jgi:hypothetical protein